MGEQLEEANALLKTSSVAMRRETENKKQMERQRLETAKKKLDC